MKYETPNMQIIYIEAENLVRTSVTEGSGLPDGDQEDW